MKTTFVSLVLAGMVVIARDAAACAGDSDCKGDRICDDGKCVSPKPKKKPVSKPKEVAKPKDEATEEEQPVAAPVAPPPPPSTPPSDVEPSSSPWRGAHAPVKAAITLVLGESFRANENVYYGTGFGLQVGFTNTAGIYFGGYWHEHLRNEKSETKSDALLGRVQAHATGRTSYYLLEIGAHTNVNPWLNLRWVNGLGLAHFTGEATVYFPDAAVPSSSASVDTWGFVLQPKFAALLRPGPAWYLGPQLGITWIAKDGDFGIGAWESQGIVGWVL